MDEKDSLAAVIAPIHINPESHVLGPPPHRGFDAAIAEVASRLKKGDNIVVLDANHFNPEHGYLLSDKKAVAAFAKAGAHDYVLEMPAPILAMMDRIKAAHATTQETHNAVAAYQLYASQAAAAGRSEDAIKSTVDLIENTAQQHVTLHGVDPSLAQAVEAVRKMPPHLQKALLEAGPNALAVPGSDAFKRLTPDQKEANSIVYSAMIKGRLTTGDATQASRGDEIITDAIVHEVGSRPVVAQYGAGHTVTFRGIDHLLAEKTGRPTTTIALFDPATVDTVNKIIDLNNGAVSVPNLVFDNDHLYKTRPDVLLIAGCEDYRNLPTKLCSTDITNEALKAPHTPNQSASAKIKPAR